MIPSLPTELLQQIFDSICQPLLHFSSYKQRQFTLRSLCLTSRLFRSIAQPLLVGELLWVESEASLNEVLSRFEVVGGGSMIRCLILVDGDRAFGITRTSVKRAMLNCPNLSSFSLNVYGIELQRRFRAISHIDTTMWTFMSRLTSLQLSLGDSSFDDLVALPRLRYLSLVGRSALNLRALLTPELVPSLRHLSLSSTEWTPTLVPSQAFLQILHQLDLIDVDYHLCCSAFDFLTPFFSKTILRSPLKYAYSSYAALSTAHHFELTDIQRSMPPTQLSRIISLIDDSKRLRSIYLSLLPPHQSSPPSREQTRPFTEALEDLTARCTAKGIELHHYEQASEHFIDERIYEDFMRRRRRNDDNDTERPAV